MGNRRKHLNIPVLALIVLALLASGYKLGEWRTEAAAKRTATERYDKGYANGFEKAAKRTNKESYRKGYTYGYVEGHTNGYEKGVNTWTSKKINCSIEYGGGVYADVSCIMKDDNRYDNIEGWIWPEESYVGPGPEGVPATSGPNAK
jgi:hypothetical protein